MTPTEALRIASEWIGGPHDMLTTDPTHCAACADFARASEAAAVLAKLAPFVEAAMEWGESDSEWRTAVDPDDRRALRMKSQDICQRMLTAYRALVSPTEEPK